MKCYFDALEKLGFDKILERAAQYCATELGKKKMSTLKPSSSVREIEDGVSLVSEMRKLLESDVEPVFDGITNVRAILQRARIEGNVITAEELRKVANCALGLRTIRSYLGKRDKVAPMLAHLSRRLFSERILEFNINAAIDEKGDVRDSASQELHRIRKRAVTLSSELRDRLGSILKRLVSEGWAQDEIISTRDGRLVIPVKAQHKGHVAGFVHSTSGSGATVFIEPAETLEMNNEIRALQFEEAREIQRILSELTDQVRDHEPVLSVSLDLIEIIDVIYAKAKYSIALMASAPKILGHGKPLALREARHPILLEQAGRDRVIASDISVGAGFQTLVISGPNAGGKSVALKTVGLLTAMLQSGFHIPASPDSEVPVFEKLFVDIGDDQSIESNLSTFTSHLQNLKTIAEDGDARSLALIDEIAAGTDPSEGGALAAAFLKTLTARKCLTIVTTHNSFLKVFAYETEGIENGSMEFDHRNLQPTYKLTIGVPGSSYALEIARRMGVDERILEMAKGLQGESAVRIEKLLIDLESRRQALISEQARLREAESRVLDLAAEYDSKIRSLRAETKRIRKEAIEESKRLLEESNALIERVVRQIREHQASKGSVDDARRAREQWQTKLIELESTNQELERPSCAEGDFRIGDLVAVTGTSEVGEIVEIIDSENFKVATQSLKLTVAKGKLTRAESRSKGYRSRGIFSELSKRQPTSKLDVRGLTGDEAIEAIERFFDDAVLGGLHRLEIIHGKGTGALKKRITAYLKKNPQVTSFRLGEWNEGGTGATIVEIR